MDLMSLVFILDEGDFEGNVVMNGWPAHVPMANKTLAVTWLRAFHASLSTCPYFLS